MFYKLFLKTCKFFEFIFVKTYANDDSAFQEDSSEAEAGESFGGEDMNFEKLFARYFDRVYQFFYFRLRNVEDAQDLSSDTFAKIFEKLDSYEDRGYKVSTWIFTVARNTLIDFYRKNKQKITALEDVLPSDEPKSDFDLKSIDREILKEEVWEAIKTLPEKEQEVWSLKLVNEFSHKEIAEVLGTSTNNIDVILHRSSKKLKMKLAHLK